MGDDDSIKVPIEAIRQVDPRIQKHLPTGATVTGVSAHSTSLWTRTARIDAISDDNGPIRYFLKATFGERGRRMVMGEFLAMSKMYEHSPALVPQPLAWGAYETIDEVFFLLCEFRDMITGLPDLERFPGMIANLHKSITSPDGRFGFDCTTYHGNVPIEHGWSDSWEGYFTRTTRILVEMEQKVWGHSHELLALSKPFFEVLVPRLLRPLESDGRSIRPCLIHGDLWHGNAATDKETNGPVIFDAAGFYAHNEYELAVWRQPWNEIGAPYRERYCQHFAPAEPAEDFEDRGLLYSIRVNLLDSILYTEDHTYRETVISTMKGLVEKFTRK